VALVVPVLAVALVDCLGTKDYIDDRWTSSVKMALQVNATGQAAPVVQTSSGKVVGLVEKGYTDIPIYSYKGIPYAADTSGANRWQPPQDPEPWSGVRNTTTWGHMCMQPDPRKDAFQEVVANASGFDFKNILDSYFDMSEDCLVLNVFSPSVNKTAKAPVMVWIHGGGLVLGSGQGASLGIVNGGTVLVTINFRLGFLGYFAHPELSATNFGLRDQIKALEWIQENIGAFGGDPSQVTILGGNSGGTSVLSLMVSPMAKGLFKGAIAESCGVFESLDTTMSEGGKLGVEVGEVLGVPEGPAQLARMRALPAEDFISTSTKTASKFGNLAFLYVDNATMTTSILRGFEEGKNHDVPLIMGVNGHEMMVFEAVDPTHFSFINDLYKETIDKIFRGNPESVLSILPEPSKAMPGQMYSQLETDVMFGAPAYIISKAMASRGELVYLGLYNETSTNSNGTMHGPDDNTPYLPYELPDTLLTYWTEYAVGDPTTDGLPHWNLFSYVPSDILEAMVTYWTEFAHTGSPNGPMAPYWDAFQLDDQKWQVFGLPEIESKPIPESTKAIYTLAEDAYPANQTRLLPNIAVSRRHGDHQVTSNNNYVEPTQVWYFVLIGLAAIVVIAALSILIVIYRRRRKSLQFRSHFPVIPASPQLDLPHLSRTKSSSEESLFDVIKPCDVTPYRCIGSGAFGTVYEAKVKKYGKVAVKLVNIGTQKDSFSQFESFKREVDVLARVKHNNVVTLHGACMRPPNVFIVMEKMEMSLRDKLDEVGRLSYKEILKLANEIASALAYLHPSIVHRDLKPQNILIDAGGSAKVADFGIAKFKQSTYMQTTKGNGTPFYMAPESFSSYNVSEKSDVYSLGMILWECLTGQMPWKDQVLLPFQVVVLVSVRKQRPPIPEDCPKQLASLIQRCWDDDPHRRPSCAEVERKTRLLLHDLDAMDTLAKN